MPWSEHIADCVLVFNKIINTFFRDLPPSSSAILCRGQADAGWQLIPSLLRHFPEGYRLSAKILSVEQEALKAFKAKAHLYLDSRILQKPRYSVDWFMLMQHYNTPTRLLDWSLSPYVAAYFAVEKEWDQDGAVWLFSRSSLELNMVKRYKKMAIYNFGDGIFDPSAEKHLFVLEESTGTDRMVAQKGVFTICKQILANHGEIIERAFDEQKDHNLFKIIIPSCAKPDLMKWLQIMNIGADSLFPGIDGMGRSINELVLMDIGLLKLRG